VVGNAHYRNANLVLPNPQNDAKDTAAVLRDLDFEVIEITDARKPDFDKSLANFARLATGADVALFYYAGHALQFKGRNYLMPVDAEFEDEVSLRYQMVSIDDIRDALGRAGGLKIIILDACRNNPVVESLARKASGNTRALYATRGLARIDRGEGLVVGFSTAADDVALDGDGRNSPYTRALLKRLQEPGLEVEMMFRRVAADVNSQTGGRQRPETYVSLIGEYYLNQKDRIAWEKIRSSDDAALLSDFVKRFPTSPNAFDARNRLRDIEDAARDKQLKAQNDAIQNRRDEEIRKRIAALEAERAQRDAAEQKRAEETAKREEERKLATLEVERKLREAAQKRAEESAKAEAAKKAEDERKRVAALETERKQREAEQKRAQETARADAAKRAEEERKRVAALEAEKKQREAEQKRAEETARAEAAKRAEEERKRVAALEAEKKQREAEQKRAEETAKAEAAKRAEDERKRVAALELQRAQREAEQKRLEAAQAEAAKREEQRRAESEARAKAAEAETAKQRELEQRALAEAANRQQVASLDAGESSEAACKRDEERLLHLRAAPVADDVLRFEHELTCAKLRPQVVRLRESVVGPRTSVATTPAAAPTTPATRHADTTRAAEQPAANPAPAPQNATPPPQGAVASAETACTQDSEKLARLRVSRSLVEIKRFETELTCERLRKQVLRLRESVEAR